MSPLDHPPGGPINWPALVALIIVIGLGVASGQALRWVGYEFAAGFAIGALLVGLVFHHDTETLRREFRKRLLDLERGRTNSTELPTIELRQPPGRRDFTSWP